MVLIIGGGPAGLACAIVAKTHGHRVTVIERRDSYTRPQTLFLFDDTLKLLQKWKVDTSPIKTVEVEDGTSMGFVKIKQLEEQLAKKVVELGVEIIFGTFQGLKSDQTAIITTHTEEITVSYDILVGADGTHSKVREAIKIEKNVLGAAKGATAIVFDEENSEINISPAIKVEDGFLRRTKVPHVSIIFGQFPHKATKDVLQRTFQAQGWNQEALAIAEDKALVSEERDVFLYQACAFSNEEKSAILIGDAAATASFFQGMGANTALKVAEAAGLFFEEFCTQKELAFYNFNQKVMELTTAMIEDSSFLF